MAGEILQSGQVSPGHLAVWVANGIAGDGGPILASQKVLASIRGANFNTTADQPIILPPSITAFQLTGLLITNASISLSVAIGGFYTQASKNGNALVSAGQAYSSLTNTNLLLMATLTAYAQTARLSSSNLPLLLGANNQNALGFYFALSTPQSVAATADIYALGIDLS